MTTTAAVDATPRAVEGLGYQPALDGLRGLALLAIVAFHSQVPGVPGAFLSVSTFFTLSGFLITSVALAAHRRSGKVGIGDFYLRRSRRLLPAAFVAISAILVLTAVFGDSSQIDRLRGDAFSALYYVANWRLILEGDSYGAIFESPSTFTHFWTLAIEEQFYIVFPLLMAGVLGAARGSRKVLAVVFGVGIVASTAWSAHLITSGAGVDRVYFGTDTRLAEILVGCLAAVAWERVRLTAAAQRVAAWVGAGALVAMLWLWHAAHRTSEGFYEGGLVVYSLLTVAVMIAVIQPSGPARVVLAWRPLVWVGTVSYAAYLFHWPIIVALQERTALGPWARFGVGLTVTLLLAAGSLKLVERPVRLGVWPSQRRLVSTAVVGFVVVSALIVSVTIWRPPGPGATDFEAAAEALSTQGVGGEAPDADLENLGDLSPQERADFEAWIAQEEAIAASTAPRVAWFGDSTATMTGFGVSDWGVEHLDDLAPGKGQTDIGCGLLTGVERRVDGNAGELPAECDGWLERWRAAVTENDIDVAVVQFGPWDVHDTRLSPDGDWLVIGEDPELDAALRSSFDEGVEVLLEHVDVVVLVSSPDVTFGRTDGRDPPRDPDESEPARMEAYRALVADVAAAHDGVEVVDLAGWIDARDDDAELRPDGVHFTEETTRVVATWLAPEILRIFAGQSS